MAGDDAGKKICHGPHEWAGNDAMGRRRHRPLQAGDDAMEGISAAAGNWRIVPSAGRRMSFGPRAEG